MQQTRLRQGACLYRNKPWLRLHGSCQWHIGTIIVACLQAPGRAREGFSWSRKVSQHVIGEACAPDGNKTLHDNAITLQARMSLTSGDREAKSLNLEQQIPCLLACLMYRITLGPTIISPRGCKHEYVMDTTFSKTW